MTKRVKFVKSRELGSLREVNLDEPRWAEQVAKEQHSRLCLPGTVRDMARLQSQQGPISNGWMSVLPNRAVRTDINDVDYRVLLCRWLGLPLLPVGCTVPGCPMC